MKNNNKIIWSVLIAVAIVGSFFVGQYSGENNYSFLKNKDAEDYVLRVDVDGNGEVLRDKEGDIYDGYEDIAQIYSKGEDIFLTPLAIENHFFDSWIGCDGVYASDNMCWVAMDSSKSVLAIFKPIQ